MTYLAEIETALASIRQAGRYREIPPEAVYAADFSRNDYLALATDSRMVEAMRYVKAAGSGGARLLGGRHREHRLLEEDLARWLGRERALLFSSGYLAALGAIPALAEFAGAIYSDALNHASLVDGVRSARIPRVVYPHGALPPLAQRGSAALIVTESLFGMDGDVSDLRAMLGDLGPGDILLVDEAHALGILGTEAAGVAHGLPDDRIVILGTLGKALGCAGGFIAGPERVIELLINTARTFIFDTALPPAIAFAARVGVMLARSAQDRRSKLRANVARLHAGLRELGIAVPQHLVPIVPIPAGSDEAAVRLMQHCLERGVYAPAVRPPTVPEGSARLRVSVRSDHTDEQIDLLLERIACSATS